jgi:methionyl aminopeptidase
MKPKSPDEIKYMRKGGKILAKILSNLKLHSKIGVSEIELDNIAMDLCKSYSVTPAFLKYKGFPKSLCISINDKIVHGIPSEYRIKDGDIVSLDYGVIYKGLYTDAAISFQVGKKTDEISQFLDTVKKSRDDGIKVSKVGNFVGDISYAMEQPVNKKGYSVVKELAGHGIGYRLHEDPFILGYGKKKTGLKLVKNMTLAIESMINMGKSDITEDNDGWTIRSKDHSMSGHFEHTILVTDSNPEILTLL